MARGRLRVYLGAAPGVGKTVAMLQEGHRLTEAGVDVVVAFVETHGREGTAAVVAGLEVVPRAAHEHRGVQLAELDLAAVLARRPDLALVDELAHTNPPGAAHAKRYEDVEALLAAGIDVHTTVNVQHIESLTDVVARITGVAQRETVPDRILRAADQVELVDLTPQGLQHRLAAGEVYPAERIDAALSHYFRLGNLTALRELALLWLADEVDSALQRYRDEHAIQDTWQARERVVVAVTSGREGETLVRRGARIAARSAGGELVVVHVIATDGLRAGDPDDLLRSRALTESLGGTFHEVVGDDVGRAVVEFARGVNATQVVVGLSRRGWWARTLGGAGVGQTIIRESGSIDVHIVSHERSAGSGPLPGRVHWLGALSRRRQLGGLLLCVLGGPLLTWVLTAARSEDTIIGDVLGYQMLVIVVALVGGLWPALLTAVLSGLTLDFFFIAPFHTITIAEPSHVAGLVLYIANAVLVSLVVDLAARTTRTARRANAESELLTQIAGSVMRGDDALAAILTQTREALGLADLRVVRGGAVLARTGVNVDGGAADAADDGAASETVPAGPDAVLEARGPVLEATQRRLLGAVAAHVEAAIEAADLTRTASTVDALTEADRVRRALLSAVSHDLRRPLAAAVTAVGALRDDSVTWSEEDRTELLDTAGESLDLLTRLVTDLLDATRLQAGALAMSVRPVAPGEVVAAALEELGLGPADVTLDLADDTLVLADRALLQRVVVNLLTNAQRHGAGRGIRVSTSSAGGTVQLRVVDRGPGIPEESRAAVFQPFQREGDTDNSTGLGLGLALSRGFATGMGGSLEAEETPGGGTTMVVSLGAAGAAGAADEASAARESAEAPS